MRTLFFILFTQIAGRQTVSKNQLQYKENTHSKRWDGVRCGAALGQESDSWREGEGTQAGPAGTGRRSWGWGPWLQRTKVSEEWLVLTFTAAPGVRKWTEKQEEWLD